MTDVTRGPGRELALIAAAQVLALTTWFAASAAAPAIKAEWHLSGAEVPLLTTAVQVDRNIPTSRKRRRNIGAFALQ